MKFYELDLHLSGKLDDKEAEKIWQKIQKKLPDKKVKVAKTEDPKRIELAYPIEKQPYSYFARIFFEASPSFLTSLKKILDDIQEVLRFVVIKKKLTKKDFQAKETARKKSYRAHKSKEKASKKKSKVKKETDRKKPVSKKKTKKKEDKVKLDDIDKSLEKILEKEI